MAKVLNITPRKVACFEGRHRFQAIAFDGCDPVELGWTVGTTSRTVAVVACCVDCGQTGISPHDKERSDEVWARYLAAAWRVHLRVDGTLDIDVQRPLDGAAACALAHVLRVAGMAAKRAARGAAKLERPGPGQRSLKLGPDAE